MVGSPRYIADIRAVGEVEEVVVRAREVVLGDHLHFLCFAVSVRSFFA